MLDTTNTLYAKKRKEVVFSHFGHLDMGWHWSSFKNRLSSFFPFERLILTLIGCCFRQFSELSQRQKKENSRIFPIWKQFLVELLSKVERLIHTCDHLSLLWYQTVASLGFLIDGSKLLYEKRLTLMQKNFISIEIS